MTSEHRLGVAETGEGQKADPALVAERAKALEQGSQDLGRGEAARSIAARVPDASVVVEDVHRVAVEPIQAGIEVEVDAFVAALDVVRVQAQLGADENVRLQLGQDPPQVALRLAIAVLGGGIEVVDAELDGVLGGL